jgi:hypothetical protein
MSSAAARGELNAPQPLYMLLRLKSDNADHEKTGAADQENVLTVYFSTPAARFGRERHL